MDTLEERWWSNVDRRGDDECWPWLGYVAPTGYGRFRYGGKIRSAHRVAHELFTGPIPAGWAIDHLCHGWDETCMANGNCLHRRCVNPRHIEAVTYRLNRIRGRADEAKRAALQRKTRCARGHELTPENTYGISRCRECKRINYSLARQRRLGPVTKVCGYISPKGNPCQRQEDHDGRHHGEKPRYKYGAVSLLP